MIDTRTTNEIIKQRTLGLSFDDIVMVTSVSKPTVIKVCNDNIDAIAEAKRIASSIAKADIASAISKRRLQYSKLVDKGLWELAQRDLSAMSNGELLKVIQGAERSLTLLEGNDRTEDRNTDEWRPMSLERAMSVIESLDD